MGRSQYLPFRTQVTSSGQTPKVHIMVSGIPLDFLSFAHETPFTVKLEPILRIELQDTSCWAFDWANSEVVAIGCTNGGVRPMIFSRLPNNPARRCGNLQSLQPSEGWETPWTR